ncbi:MAG: hypothetical protein ACPLQO_02195 [Desulfotomaculales bacterium]
MAKTKKIPGRTTVADKVPVFKPTVYLDEKQIPKELAGMDVGKAVNLTVKAKLVRRTEESGGQSSVWLELQSIGVEGTQKTVKRGQKK